MSSNIEPKIEDITYDKKRNIVEEDDFDGDVDNKEIKADIKDDKKVTGALEDNIKVDIKFNVITRFFNKVNELRGKKKTEFVERFFEEYLFKDENRAKAFHMLRLILPQLDRERGSYGLKEISLAKLSLGLPTNESQRLRFFKNPNYHPIGAPVGDFVGVCISVVQGLCRGESIMTVDDVNKFLEQMSNAQDFKAKVELMTQYLRRASADDLKWTLKIILKDLKIGLKHEKVLPMYHPDALDLYNVTSNLREVCQELQDKSKEMGTDIFRLFQPMKPMLAGKKIPEEIRNVLAGKDLLIETKFDGERIQCHFSNDQIKFFSRNANDYTHIYGPKLIPIVRANVHAQAGILDGEVIVLNKHTGEAVPFGMNKTVAAEEDESEENDFQLCYMIFDILYVKGPKGEECNLLNVKLRDRKTVLKRVVKPIKHKFEVIGGHETTNVEDVFKEFDKAMLKNEEGIIIKQLDSVYSPNDRGTSWIKLKGDYMEGMTDTLDLLIIGGYFGEGRVRIGVGDWTEHITHFLLGVARTLDEKNPEKSIIMPFCKVGTGYTVDELKELRNILRSKWKKYDPKMKPAYFSNWNPGSGEIPDVIVDSPGNSVILEIKAAEMIRSNTFVTEYTLRFPRVVKIRYDKDWNECMDEQDLQTMIGQISQTKGLKKLNMPDDDDEEGDGDAAEGGAKEAVGKKRKTGGGAREARQVNVMSQFRDTDTSHIEVVSDLFQGLEFLVANVDEEYVSKKYLEEQIVRHGGKKVQNYLMLTNTHIIASYVGFRVKAIIEKYQVNVYNPMWILDSIKRGQRVDEAPKYMLYIVPWLQDHIRSRYDIYGDSYYNDVTREELREIVGKMSIDKTTVNLTDELRETREELRRELVTDENHFFKNLTFFHRQQEQSTEIKFIRAMIVAKGGEVKTKLIGRIDYVINSNFAEDQKVIIEKYLRDHRETKLVSRDWVLRKI